MLVYSIMCSSIAFVKAGEKPQQHTNPAWDWQPLADLGRQLRFPDNRGVPRSRATRSREIKLDDISRHVKNLSCEICELSKVLFMACGGSSAPLLCLACQNLKKEGKGKEEEVEKERKQRAARMMSENIVLPLKMPRHFQIVCLLVHWVPGGNDKWQ